MVCVTDIPVECRRGRLLLASPLSRSSTGPVEWRGVCVLCDAPPSGWVRHLRIVSVSLFCIVSRVVCVMNGGGVGYLVWNCVLLCLFSSPPTPSVFVFAVTLLLV